MGACLSCLGLSQGAPDEEVIISCPHPLLALGPALRRESPFCTFRTLLECLLTCAKPSESERLLYDDTSVERSGYGTALPGSDLPAPDPEEIRRHREMLERICAETADNLIDVQHTNLLTLRGKPSAEFTTLLNNHFAPQPDSSSPTQPSGPTTPNPNLSSDEPPEPPSPFTQAQLQAAKQHRNGPFSPRHPQDDLIDVPSSYRSAPQTPQKPATERTKSQLLTDGPVDDDEELDAAEEAWLKSISKSNGDTKWDEIRVPREGLMVDFPSAPSEGRNASKTR
ncbi:Oligopeptide transporter 6 [Sphaceloma murrayae]|uniref:Oligopeptide transporter 6 n=1 Tax=Sphaceloma murrayae TaxID=2082308 RepID=A0A2K1QM50_9PEZI|nr:Oligopeptide transporter 6 [Sphaceloma murrayae]